MNRKLWIGAVIILGLIVLLAVALPLLIRADRFRPLVQSQLSGLLGRPVRWVKLGFSVFGGDLRAADISIGDDPAFSNAPFVRAKSLEVGVELMPLIFSRAVHVRSLTLREPDVALLRSKAGIWNFSSLGGKRPRPQTAAPAKQAPGPALSIQTLRITGGRIRLGMAGGRQPELYDDVNLSAENVSYNTSFPFKLEAQTPGKGSLEVSGTAGPINQQDAARTPFHASVALQRMDLASTGFLDPASGLGGIVDYQGQIDSDGKAARARGTIQIDKMKVVQAGTPAEQPVSVEYASQYSFARRHGELTQGQLRTGNGVLSVTGTYDASGDSTTLHIKLDAPGLPLQDIQALLPAFGVSLPAGSRLEGGTLKTDLAVDGPIDRLVTAGAINVSDAKLAGFGLGSKLGALAAFTGLKKAQDTVIQLLRSKVRMTPEGITLDDMNLVVAGIGTITGAGTIGANQALNFKMSASIEEGGGLASIMARAGVGGAAGRKIPFLIRGTASQPEILPDAAGLVKEGISNFGKSTDGTEGKSPTDILNGLFGGQKEPPEKP